MVCAGQFPGNEFPALLNIGWSLNGYATMSSSTVTEETSAERVVAVDDRAGCSDYAPHRYRVVVGNQEELTAHLDLLQSYVDFTSIESHENVGFMVIHRFTRPPSWSFYWALLPPIVLRWVQRRPEVVSIRRLQEDPPPPVFCEVTGLSYI
ncbi:hypothetical protein C8R46DRAFT_1026727 [Mycena filopes]|nr:hypothetical protein C8R46DRAFT_1026727 [Mycena filopes]